MKLLPINYHLSTKHGFTLIELLVVIVIIGILAAVVMLAINPVEMMRRGRDATRFENLDTVRKAIDMAVAQGAILPSTVGTLQSNVAGRNCNGVGSWVNMNLCENVPTLPIDPLNNATYHYEYNSDGSGYEIRTPVESTRNYDKATTDGGSDNVCPGTDCWYEIGTDPGLDIIP